MVPRALFGCVLRSQYKFIAVLSCGSVTEAAFKLENNDLDRNRRGNFIRRDNGITKVGKLTCTILETDNNAHNIANVRLFY